MSLIVWESEFQHVAVNPIQVEQIFIGQRPFTYHQYRLLKISYHLYIIKADYQRKDSIHIQLEQIIKGQIPSAPIETDYQRSATIHIQFKEIIKDQVPFTYHWERLSKISYSIHIQLGLIIKSHTQCKRLSKIIYHSHNIVADYKKSATIHNQLEQIIKDQLPLTYH